MRTAFIKNGIVDSIEEAPEGHVDPQGRLGVASATANIGDAYANGVFTHTPPALSPAQLKFYADSLLDFKLRTTMQINVATQGGQLIALVDTSASGRADVLGLQAKVAAGASTILWRQSGGALTLTPAQLRIIAQALDTYVEAALDAWQAADAGVFASPPTITTTAQIDALGWPT